ncbi:hypothetical protein C7441_108123 [Pseudaminobacter salicylatoxidans]|uniref:Uncharacterized protein n=1 Tax=Pseudaminobacter salicylatoxidans TaxID=93369 RepID=A0A316C1W8_PSESE|nr:hypothetical protein [Pseudaminobacter salicylatoxidans]PWJ83729.1 hypothetical protein C7441_108123 [Pseudaminobacter salicylatoxidans]
MRHEEVEEDLWPLICDFFFWFSRFESALKENNWLQSKTVNATALADWKGFVEAYGGDYVPSNAAGRLVVANPQKQIVGDAGLTFTEVTFTDSASQLDRVTLLLKTVRNNLFHGGKHGSAYWDDPERIRLLLPLCITVLGELAEFGGMQADYTGYY